MQETSVQALKVLSLGGAGQLEFLLSSLTVSVAASHAQLPGLVGLLGQP